MFATENIDQLREVLYTAGELHISGLPGTGQTTLAHAVAEATGLPVVSPTFTGPGRDTERTIAAGVEAQQGALFVHLLDHGVATPEGRLTYPGVGPRVPGELRIEVTGHARPDRLVPTACIDASRRVTSDAYGRPVLGPLGFVVRAPGGVLRPPLTLLSLLTPATVAEMLSVSTKTLDRWRRGGTGPACIQVGGSVRYRAADVEAWLNANRHDPAV